MKFSGEMEKAVWFLPLRTAADMYDIVQDVL